LSEQEIREKISNFKNFLNKKYEQINKNNNNMYAEPGNNLSNRENINISLQHPNYKNKEIELTNMKDTKFSKKQKTKKIFNMLFVNHNLFKNKKNINKFKIELVNSIEKLSENNDIYKIIKKYNPNGNSNQLKKEEKNKIINYIMLKYIKLNSTK